MKRNFSDYLVATAVIACSLVLLAALTIALSGYQIKKTGRTLQIDFSDITGVKLHSEVRYAGAPAGRVIAVHPLSAAEREAAENKKNAVRVIVSINENVPPLAADVAASISSDTLLSEKFVALSGGTPNGDLLADRATIQGQAGLGLEQVFARAGPLFDSAGSLLGNADEVIARLKTDLNSLLPKISTLVNSVQTLSTDGQSLLGHADKLISTNEETIKNDLEQLQVLLKQAETVMQNANAFVGSTDQQLDARMKELRVVLQNLKVVSTQAKAITETLGEKPSRVIWGVGKPNKLTPESEILKSSEPLPAKRP